jgi:hypothetical protein
MSSPPATRPEPPESSTSPWPIVKIHALTVTTTSVASVDIYLDGRPVATTATADGDTDITIPAGTAGSILRVEGYDTSSRLVATRQLAL